MSLAYELEINNKLKEKSLAIIESRDQYTRDKTWSFWKVFDHNFEDCVIKSWNNFTINTAESSYELNSTDFPYQSIDSGKFYEKINLKLSGNSNISFFKDLNEINSANSGCYKATCYATTRLLVEGLQLSEGSYSTCFQSRLGRDPWLTPYTDKVIEKLGQDGKKKVLVFSPAFVADCLETTIEIGEEYLALFQENGGEELQLVPSLNDNEDWAEGLLNIIKEKVN